MGKRLCVPMVGLTVCVNIILVVLLFHSSSRVRTTCKLTVAVAVLVAALLLNFCLHAGNITHVFVLLFVNTCYIVRNVFLTTGLSGFLTKK